MERLSFSQATFIGIGAIVGGGIFVLGGVALTEAGPGALLALLLNGGIAFLTAYSLVQLSHLFPESGGTYVYAKRLLSVRSAFVVGWMLWLAHIVAALLYALGFAAYALSVLSRLIPQATEFFPLQVNIMLLGGAAIAFYSWQAFWRLQNGGNWINIFKLLLFMALIGVGFFLFITSSPAESVKQLAPLLPNGWLGVITAMGYTFIALQGFELIAASSGEVEFAAENVPRAMYTALGTALLVYLPLLFLSMTVGTPVGEDVSTWCSSRQATCIADAAFTYLGSTGFWIVSLSAILATLSALHANILAAAQVVQTMASDETLPSVFAGRNENHGTPEVAIVVNLVICLLLLIILPDTAAAGSAASLAFLICFSFSHGLALLAIYRSSRSATSTGLSLRIIYPLLGGAGCVALTLFQLMVEQNGSMILLSWITVGAVLYYIFLSNRAETLDAFSQAHSPDLFSYRGRSPIVLVPVANPDYVKPLAQIAEVITPKKIGRTLFLSVVIAKEQNDSETMREQIASKTQVISEALIESSHNTERSIEGIIEIDTSFWNGIHSVVHTYDCETLLLGFRGENSQLPTSTVDRLFRTLRLNVVIFKGPSNWDLNTKTKVLVPIGGKGDHNRFRARVLGGLVQMGLSEITFLRILPTSVSESSVERVERSLKQRILSETRGFGRSLVMQNDNVEQCIIDYGDENTLLLLGLSGTGHERAALGGFVSHIAKEHTGATLVIRRGA